jgi:hypothetical protein
MNSISTLQQLPPVALIALGVVAVFTATVDILALVDLHRRPVDSVVGERKWIWVLVILFVNSGLGALLYFLVGRKPAPAQDTRAAVPVAERADGALDALYGARKDGTQP